MYVTVAICTWNRAKLLDQTLSEMQKLRIPEGVGWELLVVNNNSTDETDEVIARHSGRLPIRRLVEPKQGLSNARNCAVAAAQGELILWTDDDVLVDPEWLAEYVRAARAWPDAAFFGGPVRPWYEGTPPRWLTRAWPRVANAYATRDLGEEPFWFDKTRVPFGANYAMRISVQRHYPYDPSLGRKGDGMLGGEETALLRNVLADGLKGIWVPDAEVRHFIAAERQTTRYLRGFFHGQGVFQARQRPGNARARRVFGRPLWLLRRAVEQECRYRLHRLVAGPEVWIDDLIRASTTWGRLSGSTRESAES